MSAKRKVEVLVISDVHLGTYGSQAQSLLQYLHSIAPERVVLNGDIVDIWQFSKSYFPTEHTQVLRYFMGLIAANVPVHYITGNHDETMRKFAGFKMGSLEIQNKLLLQLGDKTAWVFHGDVFDVTMQHSKWIAKLGAQGYGALILLNRLVNFLLIRLGRKKISLSKRIKNSVKNAVKSKNNFEQTAAELAIAKQYDYVICGHIHQPVIKEITVKDRSVTYLNSGDWVENLTALEYNDGAWSLYRFAEDSSQVGKIVPFPAPQPTLDLAALFQDLKHEFALL